MKFTLYSNKLDFMYNQLNSDKIQSDKLHVMKNNLCTINNIYEKANKFIDFEEELHSKGKLKDDYNTKNKKFTLKINVKNENKDEELYIYDKPKKIFVKNKKINLDDLTKKIAERYNINSNHDDKKSDTIKENTPNLNDRSKTESYIGNIKTSQRFLPIKSKNKEDIVAIGKNKNKFSLSSISKGKLKDNTINSNKKNFSKQDKTDIKVEDNNKLISNFNQLNNGKNDDILKISKTNLNYSDSDKSNKKKYKFFKFFGCTSLNVDKSQKSSRNNSSRKKKRYSVNITPNKKNYVSKSIGNSPKNLGRNTLSSREERHSILFNIIKCSNLEKNNKRKYLITSKNNNRNLKDQFKIYDSSDETDSEIFDKNLLPKFPSKINAKKKFDNKNSNLFKKMSLPVKYLDFTEVMNNLHSENSNQINSKNNETFFNINDGYKTLKFDNFLTDRTENTNYINDLGKISENSITLKNKTSENKKNSLMEIKSKLEADKILKRLTLKKSFLDVKNLSKNQQNSNNGNTTKNIYNNLEEKSFDNPYGFADQSKFSNNKTKSDVNSLSIVSYNHINKASYNNSKISDFNKNNIFFYQQNRRNSITNSYNDQNQNNFLTINTNNITNNITNTNHSNQYVINVINENESSHIQNTKTNISDDVTVYDNSEKYNKIEILTRNIHNENTFVNTKTDSHSRNLPGKIVNYTSEKDLENTKSNFFNYDESTNFCNINSKGSNFNTLDSCKITYKSSKKNSISKKSSVLLTKKNTSKKNISNYNYGIFFKDINKTQETFYNSKKVKSSSTNKKKEINLDLELNKINEEIKDKKLPQFKNQFKLNHYLIRDFKIGEVSNANQSSKNKMKMTENLKNFQNKKKNNFSPNKAIISSNNESFDSLGKKGAEEFKKFKNNIFDFKIKSQLNDLEMERKELDNQFKKKIQIKSKNIADKILELNNYSYENINPDEETNNLKAISKKNLEKVMRLRKILKNKAHEEIDFFLISSQNKLKEIKNENDDNFTLTLHKLGPPSFLKTKFKNETIKTYKTVNGKFFGC